MAIDFPNSPTLNQEFSVGDRTWIYDGEKWVLKTAPVLLDLDSVSHIGFDTTANWNTDIGELAWDDGEGTLAIGLKGGNVNLQIGQENVALCYNGTGSPIPDGSVVYISGAQGQRPSITLAQANAEATSSKVLGIATETIANGAEGFVATFGIVNGVDTSAFTAGQALWLSPTVAGGLTATKPVAPNHLVFVGYAISINASSGRIFVNPQNGYELDEIHDVLMGTKADRDVLMYESATGLWKNEQINLGTDTVGNYVASISTSDGISGGAAGSEGAVISLTNTDKGSSQNIFKNVAVSGQTTVVADSNNDTLTFAAGTGVTITTDAATDTVTITNSDRGSSQNIFKNITDGTNTAAADTNNDTFTLTPSTGIGIVVNATTDTATFTNTGVTSIAGTTNEVLVNDATTAATGAVTLSLPATINANTTGNAATVTNGVYTTGSYADPTWITSLAWSKISGEPTTLAGYGITDAIDTSATAQTKSGDLTISGNLTVQGTTTFLDTTNLQVEDKNIELGKVTTPSNSTADGGGITLLDGGTNKTFNWINATSSWTSSEHIDLASGKVLKIAGTEVLSATQYTGNAATATKWATARTLTIGSTGKSVDGSANVSWSLTEIGAQPVDADLTAIAAISTTGILKRTGADTWTTITDNSTNWDSAYTQRLQWDGGSTNLVAATGRTSLGATTVGSNFFTLTNPSAITFPKINADNTVTAESAATHRTSIGATTVGGNFFTLTNPSAITFPKINANNTVTAESAATHRTSIGGTTVGSNLFTLTNPSAITFLRINADNTVSALSATDFRTAIGAGTSSTTGTVTSVGMTVPTGLSVTPASITTSGTFAVSLTAGYEIPQSAAIVHIAGTETMTGIKQFNAGAETISLLPGTQDHTYIGFYARTASPGTRSAYLGFPAAANNNLTIANQISGGNINLVLTGTGIVTVGSDIQLTNSDPEIEFNNGGPRLRVPAANTLAFHTGGGLGASTNERMRIDSAGNIGIATASPVTKLHINTEVVDDNNYVYDTNSLMVVHQTATSSTVLNDTQTVLMLARQGTGGQAYGAAATFNLSRFENVGVNSRTRLDIGLANASFDAKNVVMSLYSNGNVNFTGSLTAVTKSFDIQHPTKENMRLRYGSLEGPENGVYVRGKSNSLTITLPDYWTRLVDEDTITVQLTPIGKHRNLYVKDVSDNTVTIGGARGEFEFYYFIQAERKDVDKLVVEYGDSL